MTPDLIVERAAAGDLRPLRLNPGVAGVGEAFFRRIAGLLSSQPSAAVALGRRWQSFLRYGDAPAYVWRGRGAALRADGRWKASGIAFRRAGELAAAGVDQCVFQLGAIDSMARAGQTEAAVALGRQLATRLEALGEWEAAARAPQSRQCVDLDRPLCGSATRVSGRAVCEPRHLRMRLGSFGTQHVTFAWRQSCGSGSSCE